MFRNVILLVCVVLIGVSCLKSKEDASCPYANTIVNAPTSERDTIRAYLDTMNIEGAVEHSSGFFYKISNPGTGTDSVMLCSQILINYVGKLRNGNTFDQQSNVIFVLGSLIEGWKKGIPLVKKGGQIRLFIPPTLGYGSTDVKNNSGQVVIPGNSVLVFDVTLVDYSGDN